MLLVLATLGGCWRPDPYVPPAAPDVEDDEAEGEPEATGEAPADDEAPEQEGAEGEEPEEDEEQPAFASYPARTVQAPVTIVDDWGKPLAVLGAVGWELEVRGEDTIRTRVWCGTCSPPVEGWIQAHLVARAD